MAHLPKNVDSELPGCPVMIANGLYQVDEKWPDLALRMLRDHLTDTTRTCCDQHGFALDPETGCTAEEMAPREFCHECGDELTADGYCSCAGVPYELPGIERKPVQSQFHAKLAEALRPTGTDDNEEVF